QTKASTIRRLVFTPYFVEGWGLYSEVMMREEGFYTDPAQELCHLDARIFRAARIVADTSLHCGELSFDEAVDYMHRNTGLTATTTAAPCGHRRWERLRRDWRRRVRQARRARRRRSRSPAARSPAEARSRSNTRVMAPGCHLRWRGEQCPRPRSSWRSPSSTLM